MPNKTPRKQSEKKSTKLPRVLDLPTPPIYMLDRSALIVRAKQPFVDWLNQLPDNEPGQIYTLAQANREPNLYLLPPFTYEDEAKEVLSLLWNAPL